MHPSVVDALTQNVRTCRYLAEATALTLHLVRLRALSRRADFETLAPVFNRYFGVIRTLVASEAPAPEQLQEAETVYHELKAATLQKMIRREFSSSLGDQTLDELSAVRRLTDQWSKSLSWQSGEELHNRDHNQTPAP